MKMNSIKSYLEKLRKVPRKKAHPLIHKLHSEQKISKRTLFYVKEYGSHSNVPQRIIKESFKILLLAGLLSSLGGFALESIKTIFISIMPLIILLPVLNGVIGNYGAIISSRISTTIHKNGNLNGKFQNKEIKTLYLQIKSISLVIAVIAVLASLAITYLSSGSFDFVVAGKIFLIALLDVVILVNLLFFLSVTLGIYFYKKGEDPDNFLIPITTSVADFGNMALLALLVVLFF